MSTAQTVKTQIQSLINRANEVTGNNDTDLTTAVGSLVTGYGSGGGGLQTNNANTIGTFTYDRDQPNNCICNFIKGMTWQDFCNSGMNKIYVDNKEQIFSYDGIGIAISSRGVSDAGYVSIDGENPISLSDLIVDGQVYVMSSLW